MNMKKIVLSVLAMAAAAVLLAGCSKTEGSAKSGARSGGAVSLTFFNSKGEIQSALEDAMIRYEKQAGVKVEVMVAGAGESPYTKITSLYNSGTPPVLAMLDTTDIAALGESKAVDLSNERWIEETADTVMRVNGKVYSFPFCVEGLGIIYSRKVVEGALKESFDPASINNYDSLENLLKRLRAGGIENPIVISKEDWSLGAHMLPVIYEAYDDTAEGARKFLDALKAGTIDLMSYPPYREFIKTLNLLLEYNYNKKDPLGAVYERDPIHLVDGEAALWFNGCWAWPNIAEAGAQKTDDYGFIAFPLGNDPQFFVNGRQRASPSKQVMIDREKATPEQIEAAKAFLNWLVYDEAGQKTLVEDLALIPAAKNNAVPVSDPLGAFIKRKFDAGEILGPFYTTPGDHWLVIGSAMQKYIARRSSPQELAMSIMDYWKAQQ
jgi:raffinose/stachyose/melibiose transport system substrate-binding protein